MIDKWNRCHSLPVWARSSNTLSTCYHIYYPYLAIYFFHLLITLFTYCKYFCFETFYTMFYTCTTSLSLVVSHHDRTHVPFSPCLYNTFYTTFYTSATSLSLDVSHHDRTHAPSCFCLHNTLYNTFFTYTTSLSLVVYRWYRRLCCNTV